VRSPSYFKQSIVPQFPSPIALTAVVNSSGRLAITIITAIVASQIEKSDDAKLTLSDDSSMPTVLYLRGWRLHFYSNEGTEPVHIHAQKGGRDCKYWLDVDAYEIREAYTYNMSARDTREVRKIILQHFDDIVEAWETAFGAQS